MHVPVQCGVSIHPFLDLASDYQSRSSQFYKTTKTKKKNIKVNEVEKSAFLVWRVFGFGGYSSWMNGMASHHNSSSHTQTLKFKITFDHEHVLNFIFSHFHADSSVQNSLNSKVNNANSLNWCPPFCVCSASRKLWIVFDQKHERAQKDTTNEKEKTFLMRFCTNCQCHWKLSFVHGRPYARSQPVNHLRLAVIIWIVNAIPSRVTYKCTSNIWQSVFCSFVFDFCAVVSEVATIDETQRKKPCVKWTNENCLSWINNCNFHFVFTVRWWRISSLNIQHNIHRSERSNRRSDDLFSFQR